MDGLKMENLILIGCLALMISFPVLYFWGIPKPFAPKVHCAWCGHRPWLKYREGGPGRNAFKKSYWKGPTGLLSKEYWSMSMKKLKELEAKEKAETRKDWDMKVINEELGEFLWAYSNVDGTPDQRHVDNYQHAVYISQWECNKCRAVTEARSFLDKKPSIRTKLAHITLINDGQGERSAEDWDSSNEAYYKRGGSHRRSDDP
jgi:hypothetical protein